MILAITVLILSIEVGFIAWRLTRISTCLACGSLVTSRDQDAHDEWHERLRRAVDEGETLD